MHLHALLAMQMAACPYGTWISRWHAYSWTALAGSMLETVLAS